MHFKIINPTFQIESVTLWELMDNINSFDLNILKDFRIRKITMDKELRFLFKIEEGENINGLVSLEITGIEVCLLEKPFPLLLYKIEEGSGETIGETILKHYSLVIDDSFGEKFRNLPNNTFREVKELMQLSTCVEKLARLTND